MAVRIDLDLVHRRGAAAGQGIELDQALDLVAEQRDAPGPVLQMRRPDLDHVAAHAEAAAIEAGLVAPVLQLDERSEEHTSELQSLMRISYAVFSLKKKQRSLN